MGVGLQNVRRRLEICYGAGAELRFSPGMEFTTVEIRIPRYGAHPGMT
jgi:LytS/YehU family sensor histidine kinase